MKKHGLCAYFVLVVCGVLVTTPVFADDAASASTQGDSGFGAEDAGILAGVVGVGALFAAPDLAGLASNFLSNNSAQSRDASKKLVAELDGSLDMAKKRQLVAEFEKNVGSVGDIQVLASQRKELQKERVGLQKDIAQTRLALASAASEQKDVINQKLESLSESLRSNRIAQDENVHKQLQAGIQLHQEHEREHAASVIESDAYNKKSGLMRSLNEFEDQVLKYSDVEKQGLTEEQAQHKKQLEAQIAEYKKQLEAIPQEREKQLAALKAEGHGLSAKALEVLKETRQALEESSKKLEKGVVHAHAAPQALVSLEHESHESPPHAASEHVVSRAHGGVKKEPHSGVKEDMARRVNGKSIVHSMSDAKALHDKPSKHVAPKSARPTVVGGR